MAKKSKKTANSAKRTQKAMEPRAYALPSTMRRTDIGVGTINEATERLWRNCLYPKNITFDMYYQMYARNNVAARVIETFPDYSWNIMPLVTDSGGIKSRFSRQAASLLTKNFQVQEGLYQTMHILLKQLDVLGGIGGESLLIFGFADGKRLHQPVEKKPGMQISWIKLLHNGQFEIEEREEDERSMNFGDAKLYKTKDFVSTSDMNYYNGIAPGVSIHYTRCVHFKESAGLLYGTSRIQKCYNQLLDIMKLSGASAELYYLGAFSGLSIETDPQAMLSDESYENMKAETAKYFDGLARSLIFEGAKAKLLYPAIVSPKDHFDLQITMISIATGIPRRFLTGAEAAKLASQQDTLNWEGRVTNRRDSFAGPRVVMPMIERCINAGVITAPRDNTFTVTWPRTQSMTLEERSDSSRKMTEAILSYFSTGLVEVIPFEPYLVSMCGYDESEAKDVAGKVDISKWKNVASRVVPMEKDGGDSKKDKDVNDQLTDMVGELLDKMGSLGERMAYMKGTGL